MWCLWNQLSHHPVPADNQEARAWIVLRVSGSYLTNISEGGIHTPITKILFTKPKLTGVAFSSHTGCLLWNSPLYLFFDWLQNSKFPCVFYVTFQFLLSPSCYLWPVFSNLSLLKPSCLDSSFSLLSHHLFSDLPPLIKLSFLLPSSLSSILKVLWIKRKRFEASSRTVGNIRYLTFWDVFTPLSIIFFQSHPFPCYFLLHFYSQHNFI